MIFKDRVDAATRLAKKLDGLKVENPIILAIPRGGVVTGDVIAKILGARLDIIVSRKIGAPDNPELAIGAVVHDGSFFPNSDLISMLRIPREYIANQIESELKEIQRRLVLFRGNKEYDLKDKTVIIVDDGIATGATIFIALEWIKKQEPRKIVIATPVAPKDTAAKLSSFAEVIVLHCPTFFSAVGEFYESFEQVEDKQVVEIMKKYGYRAGTQ